MVFEEQDEDSSENLCCHGCVMSDGEIFVAVMLSTL